MHTPLETPGALPTATAGRHEAEIDLNVAEYLGLVRRHWKIIAALTALSLGASLTHYWITPKVYTAEAQIQIKRKSLSPLVNTQNPWIDAYNIEFFPTQYELLRSRGLAERVVINLDLMADPAAGAAAATPAGAEKPRKPSAAEDQAVLGRLADGLRGGLSVVPIRNTELVKLTYQNTSPEYAAKVANGFAEAFIDMGVEDRYNVAGKASTFLGSQIEALKKEVDDKEAQLQALSRKSDLVTLGTDGASNVNLERLEALNGSYIEAKRNRIEKEATYQELQVAPKETVADSLGGGVVSDLRAEQLRLERDYETKLKTYKPEWPAMQELQAQIQKGRQHLEGVMQEMVSKAQKGAYASYLTALRQENALGGEIARIKGTVMDQSSDSVVFTNLKMEIDSRRNLLNDLIRKQSETEVTARLQDTRDSNVTIVDRALVPGAPAYPSLRKSGTSGLLFGLMASAVLILLIEFLDRTIKSPEEVERRLGLPTLAVIPDISERARSEGYGYGLRKAEARPKPARSRSAGVSWLEKKKGTPDSDQIELTPHQKPRSPVAEAYRELRTGLLLSTAAELKIIAITSAAAGEGKTATSTNLAVVLAQLGRRVLLVDGDLRKPRLHQVFHVSNRIGLVNQLTGTAEPDAIFLKTEIPNLWLTPSGPIPPNPSELLSSERMRDWLKSVKEQFDTVILDTPPTLAVTDGTILGAMADGVLLTLRAGKVTREDARACRDRLRFSNVRILGVALNRYRALQGLGKGYRYYESYGAYEQSKPANPQAGSAA